MMRKKSNETCLNSRQAKLLPTIANPSLKMVHIRQSKHSKFGVEYQKTNFVTQEILRFNQTGTSEPLDDHSSRELSRSTYGWEARALYILVLDLFRKSTGFPSLEVLAYGDFSEPVVENRKCLLVVKDTLVPAGCTVISASELESYTTVKSPMSFLAAFNMRPKTFWV